LWTAQPGQEERIEFFVADSSFAQLGWGLGLDANSQWHLREDGLEVPDQAERI
jgi:hypothetical protein